MTQHTRFLFASWLLTVDKKLMDIFQVSIKVSKMVGWVKQLPNRYEIPSSGPCLAREEKVHAIIFQRRKRDWRGGIKM